MYRKIISDNLKYVFPNFENALENVHVHDGDQLCMCRRTFIFKTESTMGQQRLYWLSLMCLENNNLNTIDFYTDISCLGGVFAKNTIRETNNFGSGNVSSLDWYFSQIPLPNMKYLYKSNSLQRNFANVCVEHLINNK